MQCGMDFGTSNSVIYISGANQEQIFVFSEPTVLFFPDDTHAFDDVYVGQSAIDAYLASGMTGRFFQSIKSLLNDPDYTQTEVRSIYYNLVDLLELIMAHLKQAAEDKVGPICAVTIGRPVYFSENPEADQLAQTRLYAAAKRVGFTDIKFQFEPIAAALAYETHLKKPETVLVADFGGGTTDFTIMRLSPTPSADRKNDILAIGGVYIGGDTLDARVMWNQITPYFGRGSTFKDWHNVFELPSHFFHVICAWADIAKLKTKQYQIQLREILRGATDKKAIERLITLINYELGFAIFKAIEKAKKDLSKQPEACIYFDSQNIHIEDLLTEESFCYYIKTDCEKIQEALTLTFQRAQLTEADIDTVFLTGGTALVKKIRQDFDRRFGSHKLNAELDLFTSVAKGLSLSFVVEK